nr:abnormal spindle-like microcephaly-associated protein homolog [Tanacetum cinerariifolium]
MDRWSVRVSWIIACVGLSRGYGVTYLFGCCLNTGRPMPVGTFSFSVLALLVPFLWAIGPPIRVTDNTKALFFCVPRHATFFTFKPTLSVSPAIKPVAMPCGSLLVAPRPVSGFLANSGVCGFGGREWVNPNDFPFDGFKFSIQSVPELEEFLIRCDFCICRDIFWALHGVWICSIYFSPYSLFTGEDWPDGSSKVFLGEKRDSTGHGGVELDREWRGPKHRKDELWIHKNELENKFSSTMYSRLKVSLGDICSLDDMKERMATYLSLTTCKVILDLMTHVTKNIDEGRLKVKAHCPIVTDVGMKENALKILMSNNPVWLRVGLYIVFG